MYSQHLWKQFFFPTCLGGDGVEPVSRAWTRPTHTPPLSSTGLSAARNMTSAGSSRVSPISARPTHPSRPPGPEARLRLWAWEPSQQFPNAGQAHGLTGYLTGRPRGGPEGIPAAVARPAAPQPQPHLDRPHSLILSQDLNSVLSPFSPQRSFSFLWFQAFCSLFCAWRQ